MNCPTCGSHINGDIMDAIREAAKRIRELSDRLPLSEHLSSAETDHILEESLRQSPLGMPDTSELKQLDSLVADFVLVRYSVSRLSNKSSNRKELHT